MPAVPPPSARTSRTLSADVAQDGVPVGAVWTGGLLWAGGPVCCDGVVGVDCTGGAVLVEVDCVGVVLPGCVAGCLELAQATVRTDTATRTVTGMA